MKQAEYPQRTCREPMMSEMGLGYNCELPLYHHGPCATFSIKTSVIARNRWEEEHPDIADGINDQDIHI